MGRVQDKVVISTGGAGGLGGAAARLLTNEGAKVTITDVAEVQGGAFAREIGADFLPHDVSSEEQWRHVVLTVDRK